jgi:hypothetical protein
VLIFEMLVGDPPFKSLTGAVLHHTSISASLLLQGLEVLVDACCPD